MDRNYEIDAPNFAFTVQKPGEYRVDVSSNGDSEITLHKGRGVASMVDQGEEELRAPALLKVANGSSEFTISRRFKRDDWDRWSRRRDSIAYYTRPLYLPPGVYGYETMRGYGRWVQSQGYGPLWVPVVEADWQPYRLGRWVWVDPFGWTWVSYESWGWAPYHYGRWTYIGGTGWAWVPGPPTVRQRFGAALVAFLSGNQGGEWVGWFPLGPGEVYHPYVSREVYVERPVRQYVNYNYVTVVNRTEIYNSTTVVYNTRVVDRQVIERAQVVTHCDVPPSRETLYTPAVQVKGNQVVRVSGTQQPAPRPTEQVILRNVHVRTPEVPTVRKFDDKLAEMEKAGTVRPVNPYQPAHPEATVNREPGNSAIGAKVAIEKPNPLGHNEPHGHPGGVPPGLMGKDIPAASPSATGRVSVPAATTNSQPVQVPGAREDKLRPSHEPPEPPDARIGRPSNTPQVEERSRPKDQPPEEVERRLGQPRPSGLAPGEPKEAVPSGQNNERRNDEPRPVAPPHEQARPAYQPPQEVERRLGQPSAPAIQRQESRPSSQPLEPPEAHANRRESEPSEPRRPGQLSAVSPPGGRAQQSLPTQLKDSAAPAPPSEVQGPTQSRNAVQPDQHNNGYRSSKTASLAQPLQQSKQPKREDSPGLKSESKKNSNEGEAKGKN